MESKYKYVAFGIGYQDQIGTVIEESENYYIVNTVCGVWYEALPKNSKLVKVFETEEERNNWISDQNYQYDPR